MPALPEIQHQMARAIAGGPSFVPHHLFAGDAHRVTLGFAVHANTISHGRLTALEDACPQVLRFLGVERFNALSRAFIEEGSGNGEAFANIARSFPAWLDALGEFAAAYVARFDAMWLAAYRAREAKVLTRADIAMLDEVALLALPLVLHPAAALCPATPWLLSALELEDSAAILVTRPDANRECRSVDSLAADLFALAWPGCTFGEALAALAPRHSADATIAAALTLIDAGALAGPEETSC